MVWREAADLPQELIFDVNYLGGNMPTFALNFSRPGGQVIAQYYSFLRLGREGYARIHGACYETARYHAKEIGAIGPFEMICGGDPAGGIPALCRKVKQGFDTRGYTLYDLADRLRGRGWQVPAYSMPAERQDLAIQRILVRHGVSYDLATLLIVDLKRSLEFFAAHPVTKPMAEGEAGSLYHN